jgi:hypothetical protein
MMLADIAGIRDSARAAISRLNAKAAAHQAGLNRGLRAAGLLLYRYSQLEVPVDYGILKASGFVRVIGTGWSTAVQVGYTASYAIFVHENLDAFHGDAFNTFYAEELAKKPATGPFRHNRGLGQKSKFLEDPALDHAEELKETIAREITA